MLSRYLRLSIILMKICITYIFQGLVELLTPNPCYQWHQLEPNQNKGKENQYVLTQKEKS